MVAIFRSNLYESTLMELNVRLELLFFFGKNQYTFYRDLLVRKLFYLTVELYNWHKYTYFSRAERSSYRKFARVFKKLFFILQDFPYHIP